MEARGEDHESLSELRDSDPRSGASDADEARRVDLELLAWTLCAGVVGIALKSVPFALSIRGAPEGLRARWAWEIARELSIVVVAAPVGLATARSTGLGAPDLRAAIAREPDAWRRIGRGIAIALATVVVVRVFFTLVRALLKESLLTAVDFPAAVAIPMSIGAGLHEE